MPLNFITWNPSVEIFSLEITESFVIAPRWYGLLFAMGFVVGYIIMQKIFKKEGIPIKVLDQLTTYMIVATIIGARLGHVFFYEPAVYLNDPIQILYIWKGGLASHGAGIAIVIALLIFSKKNNKPFIWILDRIAIVVALAGFFIRWGNLMNSEIYGIQTSLPWGFIFVQSDPSLTPHHPTQIYEALAYLGIFIILWRVYLKQNGHPRPGFLFAMYMILIFGCRFIIEFIKEPQVGFESSMLLNMGQILSIPFVLIGVGTLVYIYKYRGFAKKDAGS